MKLFITGVGGQLGYDVIREAVGRGYECIGSDIADETGNIDASYVKLDITDKEAVRCVLGEVKPDVVVHCAAWTAVDAAEDEENKQKVYAINVDGTRNIAKACREIDCKMIYISTDYVFDGKGDVPRQPDCDNFAPQNYYGLTKLQGENAVRENLEKFFIVRIAWVFGKNGNNFVRTMLNLAKKYSKLRVVCDQIGTPTYTADLARLLIDMAESEKYGCYHATNEGGYISWYDFAQEIFALAGVEMELTPVTTAEYGVSKAVRPFNSRLDKSKLRENGFEALPGWRDALLRYLEEISDEQF